MIQADLFRKVGGFDTRYAPAYYEDTDLANLAGADWSTVVACCAQQLAQDGTCLRFGKMVAHVG